MQKPRSSCCAAIEPRCRVRLSDWWLQLALLGNDASSLSYLTAMYKDNVKWFCHRTQEVSPSKIKNTPRLVMLKGLQSTR